MDKKYVGRVVALPKDVADALVAAQRDIAASLGFEPSLPQTIAFLIAAWQKHGHTKGKERDGDT